MAATKMSFFSGGWDMVWPAQFNLIGIFIAVMCLLILLTQPAFATNKTGASKSVGASVTILRPFDTVSATSSTKREKKVQFTTTYSIRDCAKLLGPDTPLHRAQQCQLNLIELN